MGELFERAFARYRQAPLAFLLLAAGPLTIQAILDQSLFGVATPWFREFRVGVERGEYRFPTPEQLVALIPTAVIGSALSLALLSVLAATLTAAMSSPSPAVAIGPAFRAGLAAAPRLLIAAATALGLFIGALTVGLVILAAVSLAVGDPLPFLIGVLASFAISIYIAVSWALLPAVVTLEAPGPVRALRLSWALAAGRRRRIFAVLLLIGLLQIGVGIVVGAVTGVIGAAGLGGQGLDVAATIATGTIVAPLEWGVLTLLYERLRARADAPPAP